MISPIFKIVSRSFYSNGLTPNQIDPMTMQPVVRRFSFFLATILLLASAAQAEMTIEVSATDWGWYSDSGFHNPNSSNYIAGYDIGGEFEGEFRNFAVFDLGELEGQILSASLVLLNDSAEGYDSPDDNETYTLFDVNSEVENLVLGEGGTAAFEDLGSGSIFGSVVVSDADNNSSVTVDLNSTAIAALNTSSGTFAIGGALTTLSDAGIDEQIFARSNLNPDITLQFKISSVPEPATLLSFSLLSSFCLIRRRRQQHSTKGQREFE